MISVPWSSTHLDRRASTILDVATESLGLYVTPPVSHLELAARLPEYRPSDLDASLQNKDLIGLRTLRGSAILMPVDLLPVVVPATRRRNVRAFATFLEKALGSASYEVWADRVMNVFEPGEALSKSEITERLDPPESERRFMTDLISQVATENRLVGLRVSASWRSGRIAYMRWSDWLPDVDVVSPDPAEMQATLATMYLRSFGPATVEDFAWWSGLTKTEARTAIHHTDAEAHDDWFDIDPQESDPPRGVRLLPIWDTLFVTWKDRTRFIPEHLVPYLYDASGNATSVVLINGEIAGVWAMGSSDRDFEVRFASFEPFTKAQRSLVEEEANLIAGLAGAETVTVIEVETPPNLREGKRNLFMRPV